MTSKDKPWVRVFQSKYFQRRAVVFSICLLIATLFWFLNALQQSQSAKVDIPISLTNLPEGTIVFNLIPTDITVEASGSGFDLFASDITAGNLFPIDLGNNIWEIDSTGVLSTDVTKVQILKSLEQNTKGNTDFVQVISEGFEVRLDSLISKEVDVSPVIQTNMGNELSLRKVTVTPSQITLTGPAAMVRSIDVIKTKTWNLEGITSTITKVSTLEWPNARLKGINKDLLVEIEVEIERTTELTEKVNITAINIPSEFEISLYPKTAEVKYIIGLSRAGKIGSDDFELVVNFEDYLLSNTRALKVTLAKQPEGVKSIKVNPEIAEFIIKND